MFRFGSPRSRLAVLGLALSLVASACAGATPGTTPSGAPATGSAQPSAAVDIPEFVVSKVSQVGSLDTAKATGDLIVACLVSESLEDLHVDGTFGPRLAVSAAVSKDKVVYQIRPNLKFSDGKVLTVDDVVYSIQRSADPKLAPGTSALLTFVGGVSATGPNEVTVALKTPDARARTQIAYAARIWEKAQVEADSEGFGSASALPVGTGPYRFAQLTGSEVVLDRNDAYWGPKPPIKRIRFTWVADENTAQLAMRSGELHMRYTTNSGAGTDWKSVPGATVLGRPSQAIAMFSMDTSKPPFDDVHVRRAFAYALDRANLAKIVYGDYAQPLSAFIPSETLAVVASPAEAKQFIDGLPQYTFDLNKAKAELAQSKYPTGLTVDAYTATPTFPHGLPVLQSLQQNLSPLGVKINIHDETYPQWAVRLTNHKDLGFFTFQYYPLGSDPAFVLARFFGKATLPGNNTASWAPAELEDPISVIATSTDKAARFTATKTVLTAVATDVPWIPLASPQVLYVIGKAFKYDTSGDRLDIVTTWPWKISSAP